jgi:hypothetical protein
MTEELTEGFERWAVLDRIGAIYVFRIILIVMP